MTDLKDEPARRLLSDLRGALEQRYFDEMVQLEAALQRLDSETNGYCADWR